MKYLLYYWNLVKTDTGNKSVIDLNEEDKIWNGSLYVPIKSIKEVRGVSNLIITTKSGSKLFLPYGAKISGISQRRLIKSDLKNHPIVLPKGIDYGDFLIKDIGGKVDRKVFKNHQFVWEGKTVVVDSKLAYLLGFLTKRFFSMPKLKKDYSRGFSLLLKNEINYVDLDVNLFDIRNVVGSVISSLDALANYIKISYWVRKNKRGDYVVKVGKSDIVEFLKKMGQEDFDDGYYLSFPYYILTSSLSVQYSFLVGFITASGVSKWNRIKSANASMLRGLKGILDNFGIFSHISLSKKGIKTTSYELRIYSDPAVVLNIISTEGMPYWAYDKIGDKVVKVDEEILNDFCKRYSQRVEEFRLSVFDVGSNKKVVNEVASKFARKGKVRFRGELGNQICLLDEVVDTDFGGRAIATEIELNSDQLIVDNFICLPL